MALTDDKDFDEKYKRAVQNMVAHGLLGRGREDLCPTCTKLSDLKNEIATLKSGLEYTGMIISHKNNTINELAYILKTIAAKHSEEGALFYLRNTMDKDDCLLLHTND